MEYKDVHSLLLDNIAKSRVVTIVRSIDRRCADDLGSPVLCELGCGSFLSNEHIYTCVGTNNSYPKVPYEKIYNGFLWEKLAVTSRMETSLKLRKDINHRW